MISDQDLVDLTELIISTANMLEAIKVIAEQYQDRSLGIQIYGSQYATGILIEHGKLRQLNTLKKPTVVVEIDKTAYWKILNTENADVQRVMLYRGYYTDQTVRVNALDGDVLLHMENILKLFYEISATLGGDSADGE